MHTPGPWFIGKVEPRLEYDGLTDAGGCRIDANGVEQLCYVWNTSERLVPAGEIPPPFGSDNAEADARLIAAAPDLLEALRPFAELAELFDEGMRGGNMPRNDSDPVMEWPRMNKDYGYTVGHLRAARAAFAKATGEQ